MRTARTTPACPALLAAVACIACACGAGPRPDFDVTFEQEAVSARSFDDVASPEAVLGFVVSPPPGPSDVVQVSQSSAHFDLSRLTLVDSGGGHYLGFLPVSPGAAAGTYAGTLTLRICRDAACSQAYALSRATIPYDVRISTRLSSAVFLPYANASGASWDDTTGRTGRLIFELSPAPPATPFVHVVHGGGLFTAGPGTVTALGGDMFLAALPFPDAVAAGRYSGYLALEVCEDAGCARPYARLDAWTPYVTTAYAVTVHHAQAGLPPIDATFTLDGAAAAGVIEGVNGAGERTCLVPARVGQRLELDMGVAPVTIDVAPSDVSLIWLFPVGFQIDGLTGGVASADALIRIRTEDGRRLALTLRVQP